MKEISAPEAEELVRRSEELEAQKAARQAERLEKKRQKELKKRQELLEKLVAPILLIATVLISLLVLMTSQ